MTPIGGVVLLLFLGEVPWPRPNWKELLGENSKRKFEKTEVLGIMERVRLETSSLKIGNELKTFSKDLLTQIR
jgi:hypothetical protein